MTICWLVLACKLIKYVLWNSQLLTCTNKLISNLNPQNCWNLSFHITHSNWIFPFYIALHSFFLSKCYSISSNSIRNVILTNHHKWLWYFLEESYQIMLELRKMWRLQCVTVLNQIFGTFSNTNIGFFE